jgi:hypothetical protein
MSACGPERLFECCAARGPRAVRRWGSASLASPAARLPCAARSAGRLRAASARGPERAAPIKRLSVGPALKRRTAPAQLRCSAALSRPSDEPPSGRAPVFSLDSRERQLLPGESRVVWARAPVRRPEDRSSARAVRPQAGPAKGRLMDAARSGSRAEAPRSRRALRGPQGSRRVAPRKPHRSPGAGHPGLAPPTQRVQEANSRSVPRADTHGARRGASR